MMPIIALIILLTHLDVNDNTMFIKVGSATTDQEGFLGLIYKDHDGW